MSFLVLNTDKLAEAKGKWPAIKSPLDHWEATISSCTAKNPVELKSSFSSADTVTPYTVFDIGGNKWRLIALLNYKNQQVFIKDILDHAEYDKGKWKK